MPILKLRVAQTCPHALLGVIPIGEVWLHRALLLREVDRQLPRARGHPVTVLEELMPVALEREQHCLQEWMETPFLATPTTHCSARARGQEHTLSFTCTSGKEDTSVHGLAGKIAGLSEWWVQLPFYVRERLEVIGSHTFLGTLPGFKPRNNDTALTALLERWSNTTHTFLLPFDKRTITPLDFATLTGV
ncbi:conserved hypothetical protein [Ricinus communis]|uniref:Aminotransferase-like plant mobile domain-containing protein n=1 Tax=Ricinus communis TaxID=3988 RepID=B9S0P8_RICCO|nr:conserved hypothetical protein [Ricinus communis]